ncbi:S-adenosyl-L-methionine-dependent methyltransferase, partial [Pseudomassariella vexata]
PAPVYCTGHEPVIPTGRPAIQSPVEFDSHLDKSEWRYGITKLRRRLASATRGHVLEVAMGTGRNMEFYDWAKITEAFVPQSERNKEKLRKTVWGTKSLDDVELQSFTGVDISAEMLDIGLRRLRMFVPHGVDSLPKRPSFAKLAAESGGSQVDLLDGKLRVIQDDAQQTLPKPPPGAAEKYDTIVQTFGLCSVRDPTQILVNMAALVRPDTGRIILLEHGRTWWGLANGLLDRAALGHFERFGCWWNRDIEQIIREAEKRIPGLEVVAFERPGWISFGTNIWVELRV